MLTLSTFLLLRLAAFYIGISSDAVAALYLSSSPLLSQSSRTRFQLIPSSSSSSWHRRNPFSLQLGASDSGESLEISKRDDDVEKSVDVVCGEGFYKQTGPDGDYCVLDYDTIFATTATDQEEEGINSSNQQIKQQADDQLLHYWDALESQNAARRKFGMSDLTVEQYVALQAENHLTAHQNIVKKTAEAFAQFDTNQDGVVCVKELREGLQKILRKTDHLSASRALKVMEHFDDNGDGVLQPDEFITVDQLRERLDAVIQAEREEMMAMTPAEQKRQQQPQQEQDDDGGGGVSLIGRFFNMFVDTCESNFDCGYPEVCCDFGYKKSCCSSGQTARKMQLEYATVPVLQNR